MKAPCTYLALITLLLLPGPSVFAEPVAPPDDADPDTAFTMRHTDRVDSLFEEWKSEYADQSHMLVRRGVRADREAGTVEILAEASGLSSNDPVEFFLIAEASGHDYETLAVSHAMPSDVHAALTFIGMPVGAPVNPNALRYFPKGERVIITFHWSDVEGAVHEHRAEDLIIDDRTGAALPSDGLIFVGSQWIEEAGERAYAADLPHGPQSIASAYNEPTTVLDVPQTAAQGAVYGLLRPHPDRQPPYGQFLRIRLEPEFRGGQRRVADVTLDIRAGTDAKPVQLALLDEDGDPIHEGRALRNVLGAFNHIAERGQTPFVALRIGDDLPLNELRDLMRLLRSFEEEGQIHLEPPKLGDLYYRAFLPVDAHRDRARRPSQALELVLRQSADGLTGQVFKIKDARERREDEFKAEVTEFPVAGPDTLVDTLTAIRHHLPVLLVFAPANLTYGELMTWLRPVLDTHGTMYLFLEKPEED